MSQSKKSEAQVTTMSKDDVAAFLVDIEKTVLERDGADMSSLVAINHLLNLPNAETLFDEGLKTQLKDIWIKLKASGIEVEDPPLLFGLPEDFGKVSAASEEEMIPQGAKTSKKSPVKKPSKKKEPSKEEPQEDAAVTH